MIKTIPHCVIGLGFGEHHVRTVVNTAGVRLAAVVDSDPARAESVAAKYRVPAFPGVEALLDSRRRTGEPRLFSASSCGQRFNFSRRGWGRCGRRTVTTFSTGCRRPSTAATFWTWFAG